MEKETGKFHLSHKLLYVVTLFIVAASVLVILTNISINMIAAFRDYTALLSQWRQYHYQSGLHIERFGKSGNIADYQEYSQVKQAEDQLGLLIDELFKPKPDARLIFDAVNFTDIHPNEISSLLLAFRYLQENERFQNMQRIWHTLNQRHEEEEKMLETIHEVWDTEDILNISINEHLGELNRQNQQWSELSGRLMAEVGVISVWIRRFGLWVSVILGVLLVITGIIISVRINKSIKKWEQQSNEISNSLKEKEILLAEIHHRVKNNLAVISGLLELESVANHNPELALKESRSRIKSMAMIHEVLYQSNSFSHVNLKEYVQKLTDYISTTYVSPEKHIALHTDFDNVVLNINQAVPAALVLNELLANAIEHGFKSSQGQGKILVKLKDQGTCVCLSVQDNGTGFPDELEYSNSARFNIIDALVQQLKADVEINNKNGVRVQLCFQKSEASGSSNARL